MQILGGPLKGTRSLSDQMKKVGSGKGVVPCEFRFLS